MMRSMYSGVSALRAHQAKMDVIGNNIANVSTVAYKGSKVTFSEIYSQTIRGAGSSSAARGGTNPQQIGLGIKLGSVAVSHEKGSTQRTDVATDVMIDGNGLFIVSSDKGGQNKLYTRAGNFVVDESGYLVTGEGYFVLDNDLKPIVIDKSSTEAATQTDEVILKSNVNFNEEIADDGTNLAYATTVDLYNSVGGTETLDIQFGTKFSTPAGTDPAYTYRMVTIGDLGTLDPTEVPIGTSTAFAPGTGEQNPLFVKFDSSGRCVGLVTSLTRDATGVTSDVEIEQKLDPNGAVTGTPLELVLQSEGVDDIKFPVGYNMFSKLTHYTEESDAKAEAVTGNASGSLDSFNISTNGGITGVYTNGAQTELAVIGLASFDNPEGLMKVGNNMFSVTPNSGTPSFGRPSTGSFGALTPGALEMSNVDLSSEFTEMITTQRGFQANSRVITTSDEILQELVNLKR